MDRLLDKFSLPRTLLRAMASLLPLVSAQSARYELNPASIEHTPAHAASEFHVSRFALIQCTSFQYSFFVSQASQVNTSRNSTTQTPRERRAACVGSPT